MKSPRSRVLGEMRHRAVGAGFRGGRYSGASTREMRADALSGRAERLIGSSFYARDPYVIAPSPAAQLVLGLLAVGTGVVIGYYVGKWWHARNAQVAPKPLHH